MRKFYMLIICMAANWSTFSQRQTDSTTVLQKSIIPTSKQELLKDVDVIFNTRVANDNKFTDGDFQESLFNVNQFRFEIKGKIHKRVSFRFRDRYTRITEPGSKDNISRSTDLAFIKVKLSPKSAVSIGKLCADWGGYEFDLNPIDILEYNDIIENADNFLTGIGYSYQASSNHEFTGQMLNSRTRKFSDIYTDPAKIPANLTESKGAYALVGNWRGSFFGGKFQTVYSYSYFVEAKNQAMNYIALGHKYQNKKLTIMYDIQYSNEELDRKGIVSNMVSDTYGFYAQKASYFENWLRTEYLVTPKVNLLLTLMNSNAYWNQKNTGYDTGKLSSSFGVIPMVEFIPFNNMNLRFYASYVGRFYKYTNYAEDTFGMRDYNTSRISVGFIAPLLVL